MQVYVAAGKSFELETKLKQLEHNAKNRFGGGATDSDLSELEDVVAKTAARVQSTESEVRETCFLWSKQPKVDYGAVGN
jgi:hypothetical protein